MSLPESPVEGTKEIDGVAEICETVHANVGDRVPGVVTVIFDRPDARNALNAQVRAELKDILTAVAESDVRVVILTGEDEAKAFVAGADVGEFRDRSALEQREISKRPRVYEVIDNLPQPVIGRLNGHALGGGCELAQACDVRIAHERAKIGQPEINLGIMPGGGGTQRLPRLVGEGQAMRLILSGELIDAEEAHEIGLVDEVCADLNELDNKVYDLAESMASKSPVALKFAKKSVKAASRMNIEQGIEYEAELFIQLFGTEDKNEGIDAFFQDREPKWKGR
jgi:enoyl-CoA hydratase